MRCICEAPLIGQIELPAECNRNVCFQVIRFDGGEYVSLAGEFNELRSVSVALCPSANFTPEYSVAPPIYCINICSTLCVSGDSRSVEATGGDDQKDQRILKAQ